MNLQADFHQKKDGAHNEHGGFENNSRYFYKRIYLRLHSPGCRENQPGNSSNVCYLACYTAGTFCSKIEQILITLVLLISTIRLSMQQVIQTCHFQLRCSPAPPTMTRSNAEEATLSTEMIDSCCSGEMGSSSSARSTRLMRGGATAPVAPRWKAPRCTRRLCCGKADPQLLASEEIS